MRRCVLLLVLIATTACTSGREGAASSTSSTATSATTTSGAAQQPLDCPDDRTETAELDFFGDEPEKPYVGGATPEDGLEHGGYDRSKLTRLDSTDPGHLYVDAEKPYVTFARVEADGRRTMLIWVQPASGTGWVARGHIGCAKPS